MKIIKIFYTEFKIISLCILSFYILCGLLFALNLIFFDNINNSKIIFSISFFTIILLFTLFFKKKTFSIIAYSFLLVLLSILISEFVFPVDYSPDSSSAHTKLYYQIFKGWNPYYDFTINFKTISDELSLLNSDYNSILGFKGISFFSIPLLKFLGDNNINAYNHITYLFFFIYLFFIFEFVTKHIFAKKYKILISCFLLSNPFVIGMISSGYFALYFSISLFIIFYYFIEILKFKKISFIDFILLIEICLISSSSKLNTFFYINFILFFLLLFFLLFYLIKKENFVFSKKNFIIMVLYTVLIFLINLNPIYPRINAYVSSGFKFGTMIHYGNYGVWVEQKKFIKENNRLFILFANIASPTAVLPNKHPKIEDKFTKIIKKSEIRNWFLDRPTDFRAGGYGPLFIFIFILSVSLTLTNYKKLVKHSLFWPMLFFGLIIFLSVTPARAPLFARHVSQIFYIPLIFIFLSSIVYRNDFIQKVFFNLMAIIIIVNTFIIILGQSSWLLTNKIYQLYDNQILTEHFSKKINKMILPSNKQGALIQNNNYKPDLWVDLKKFNSSCHIAFYLEENFFCLSEFEMMSKQELLEKQEFFCELQNKIYLNDNEFKQRYNRIKINNKSKFNNCS